MSTYVKRTYKKRVYNFSPARYMEIIGFCRQYPEWKLELHGISNKYEIYKQLSDEELAKKEVLTRKIAIIESALNVIDEYYKPKVISYICYQKSYANLVSELEMCGSPRTFYRERRKLIDEINRTMP